MRRRLAAALGSLAVAAAGVPLMGTAPVPGGETALALGIAPIAVPDTLAMTHDRTAVVAAPGVLGNDVNLLGGDDASLDSGPGRGTLTLRGDGGYTYRPDAGYVGTDVFWYHMDGLLDSNSTSVTITISNVAAVAGPDTYTATAGVERRVDPPGVLANDTDANGDALRAALVSGVAHGSLELRDDGEVRYTASGGYSGTDAFTYRAWDGAAWSLATTVTLVVSAPAPTPLVTLPPPSPLPTLPTLPPLPALSPQPAVPTTSPSPTPSGARPDPTDSAELPAASSAPDAGGAGPGSASRPGAGGGADGTPGGGDGGGITVTPPGISPVDTLSLGSGSIGAGIELAVPALVLTVPGMLIVLAVLAQTVGAAVWLPLVRRWLGGFGLAGRRRPHAPAPR